MLILLCIEEQTYNSELNDYLYYLENDDNSLSCFKQLFFEYINSEIIHNSLLCVLNSLRKQISDIVIHQIKSIPTSKEMIRYLIAKAKANKLQLDEQVSCCVFSKGGSKRKHKTLKNMHHMEVKSNEIHNEVYSFIVKMLQEYSIKSIEKTINLNLSLEKKILKEGILNMFTSGKYDDILKDNCERHLSYFLIDKILIKKQEKIEMQENRLKELELIKIENECIICMDKQRNILFLPCNHLICCEQCSIEAIYKDQCPSCKQNIEDRININIS